MLYITTTPFFFFNMSEIILKDITFSYGKSRPVFIDTSARIEPGINLLMGPNGAGKTTLLKIMCGELQPSAGECMVDGLNVSNRQPSALRSIFFLSEDCLFPLPTIIDMVHYHAPFYPNFSETKLWENLNAFGMRGNEKFSNLSLGDRKKVNLAYTLSLGVDALLLDEPMNGLDILSKRKLTKMIADSMTDENIVVISTHMVLEMEQLFDSVMFLNNGRIMLSAPSNDITKKLAFITSDTPVNEALFTEQTFTGFHSIIRNIDGVESQIDHILLYLALASDKGKIISNIIKSETDGIDG